MFVNKNGVIQNIKINIYFLLNGTKNTNCFISENIKMNSTIIY